MKNIIVLLLAIMHFTAATAQDIHFSQFYESPLLRNPALTGIFTGRYRLQAVFRDQWRSIRGVNDGVRPFRTLGGGAEVKLMGYCMDDDALIFGFQIVHDRAGDALMTRTLPLISLSYRKQLSSTIAGTVGFYGGWANNHFNTHGLQWDDQYVGGQYSPLNPTSQPLPLLEKNYADFGAGILFSNLAADYHNWYFGFSVHHFNRAPLNFADDTVAYRQYPRYTVNTAYASPVGEFSNVKVMADVMYQADQYQVLGGFIFTFRIMPDDDVLDDGLSLGVGLLGRLRDALIPVVNINFNQFTAGFSYDVNTSRLRQATDMRGAMEFTLKFRGATRNSYKNKCATNGCPAMDYF